MSLRRVATGLVSSKLKVALVGVLVAVGNIDSRRNLDMLIMAETHEDISVERRRVDGVFMAVLSDGHLTVGHSVALSSSPMAVWRPSPACSAAVPLGSCAGSTPAVRSSSMCSTLIAGDTAVHEEASPPALNTSVMVRP